MDSFQSQFNRVSIFIQHLSKIMLAIIIIMISSCCDPHTAVYIHIRQCYSLTCLSLLIFFSHFIESRVGIYQYPVIPNSYFHAIYYFVIGQIFIYTELCVTQKFQFPVFRHLVVCGNSFLPQACGIRSFLKSCPNSCHSSYQPLPTVSLFSHFLYVGQLFHHMLRVSQVSQIQRYLPYLPTFTYDRPV